MSRRRLVGIVLVVAFAILLAARYQSSVQAQRIDSYWIVDSRTVGIQVVQGPQHSCWIANAAETVDEVRINALCREPFIPSLGGPAIGKAFRFDVQLGTPLADRIVLDGLGNPVPRCDPPNQFGPVC